jgi:hypothetical protein
MTKQKLIRKQKAKEYVVYDMNGAYQANPIQK